VGWFSFWKIHLTKVLLFHLLILDWGCVFFKWIRTAVVAYYSGWFSPDHCCRSYHYWYRSSASRWGGAGGGWEGRSGGGPGCGQRVDPGVLARQQGNPPHCSPSSGRYGPCSKVEDNAAAAKVSFFLYLKGTVFGWTFLFFLGTWCPSVLMLAIWQTEAFRQSSVLSVEKRNGPLLWINNVLFPSIHLPAIILKVWLVKNLLQHRWFRRYGIAREQVTIVKKIIQFSCLAEVKTA